MPPDRDVSSPAPVLVQAREALRAVARERRDAALALGAAGKDAARVVVAAVEAVEVLEETLAGCLERLDPDARAAVRAALGAAWEGLEAAGVVRDGTVGEPVDLGRHRVVEARGGGVRVVEVVAPGVVFRGTRVRAAAVVAGAEEGADAAGRD